MLKRRMSWCAERGVLTAPRPHSACGSCSLSAGCGSAFLERYHHGDIELPLADFSVTETPQAGTEYTVRFPAATFLALCAMLFPGLGLLMLGGAWCGVWLSPETGEAAAVIGAAAGMMVGALFLRLYDSRFGSRGPGSRLMVEPSGRVSDSDS